jgi:hypothetical protein
MSAAFIVAWLLPVIAGAALIFALNPRRASGWLFNVAGYGIVFGMLIASAATSLAARGDTQHAWKHAAPLVVVVIFLSALVVWFRTRRTANSSAHLASATNKSAKWKLVLAAFAIGSLVARAWIMLREVLLRPTYPWDAWDAWAVKSKAWFLVGHYVPFVDIGKWIAQAPQELFTGPAWEYPSALAWMQVWFASAAGDWIEPFVNLPWFALWIGLLAGHYGQWRALGVSRLRAIIFVYVLGSLPLIDTHVALAGYADLWIATLFGFSALAWLRWLEHRERDQLALAILCAAMLPLLKHEGLIWALCLAAMMIFATLPMRWRWRALVGLLVMAVIVGLFSGFALLLTVFGWVRSGSHAIELPVVGSLVFGWHGDAAIGIAYGLFVQPNWHLLWWLTPAIVFLRWKALIESESLRMVGLLLGGCLSLLLILFLFTDAARWAESYTAVNRLVMHLVPTLVTFLALLLRDAEFFSTHRDTAPTSDRRPVPT